MIKRAWKLKKCSLILAAFWSVPFLDCRNILWIGNNWIFFFVWPFSILMEFKKTGKNESVKSAVKSALQQIEEKKYETELKERGIKKIKKLAVVFKGKDVTVKQG